MLHLIFFQFARIKNVLERNGVMVTIKRKDFSFDQADLVQDLNKLLHFKKDQQKTANTLSEISNVLAMSALGATIKYLELIGDNANYGHFKLELLNLNR
jgi:DNA mismatch repair protein MSH2